MKKLSKVMIVAGEASGDMHAAKLVEALQLAMPAEKIEFFGSAGPKMRNAGVDAIVNADTLSIMGLPEVVRALPMFVRAFTKLKKAAALRKPDVVILVDFPEFNLKLARSLKRSGHRVIYYVSPQIWAWRRYRKHTIRKYVDLLITILPFEKAWYTAEGIDNVEFAGSPLAMVVRPGMSKQSFIEKHGLSPDRPIVALLPGSRFKEISRIFPIMLEAAALLSSRIPGVQFLVALGSADPARHVSSLLNEHRVAEGKPKSITVVSGETYDALNAADAAAVTSGTATLETGLIGTPLTVVYKTSSFNYRIFTPLITVPHIGLVNLIAEERIATELIQNGLTGNSLALELERLLEPEVNAQFRRRLRAITEKLGAGGASDRAAKLILERFGK